MIPILYLKKKEKYIWRGKKKTHMGRERERDSEREVCEENTLHVDGSWLDGAILMNDYYFFYLLVFSIF